MQTCGAQLGGVTANIRGLVYLDKSKPIDSQIDQLMETFRNLYKEIDTNRRENQNEMTRVKSDFDEQLQRVNAEIQTLSTLVKKTTSGNFGRELAAFYFISAGIVLANLSQKIGAFF